MTIIERLDPTSDDRFAEFHATYHAAKVEEWDRPYDAREQRVEFLDNAGYVDRVGLLARGDGGTPVGIGIAEIPLKDNPNLAYVSVHVRPDCRRRGHGSALLEGLADIGREHSRTTLFAEARWGVGEEGSGHTSFAKARGFHLDLVDAHRVLELPATIPDAPVRDGYTLHSWRGPCPGDWVDQYANLRSLIVQEAPGGDFGLENVFFDSARVRADEESLTKQGRTMQISVAVAPDGTLAGHTQLVFPDVTQEDVFQWDTLVLSEHRGHGLGLTLKVHAMGVSRDLLEGRKFVHTYNAVSNGPMISVNELMGFRHVANCGEFIRES